MNEEPDVWQLRAEHWRRVACEFAAGRRAAWKVPVMAALRLREEEHEMDWGEPRQESKILPTATAKFWGMP